MATPGIFLMKCFPKRKVMISTFGEDMMGMVEVETNLCVLKVSQRLRILSDAPLKKLKQCHGPNLALKP